MHGFRTAAGRVLVVLAIGMAALAPGCGDADVKFPPVSGSVSVNGQPVPSGNVTFYPFASKGNASQHQPMGTIDASGKFELFVPGGKKGAPAGWYKVVVYAVDDPQPGKPNKYLVNKKYTASTTTPVQIEVVSNPEPGRYDLKLDK